MPKKEPAPIKFPPGAKLAQKFPGVEESRSYGTPAIKAGGKILARLRSEAEGGLALRCDFAERQALIDAAPETFYITDHYTDWPMVLINLETVVWDAMPDLIEDAWRLVAPPRLIKQLDPG